MFCIRVKRKAASCNFKCASATCSVSDILIRDQIILGTKEEEIRRAALKDQWSLEDLLKNSRPIIASDRGLKVIKKEPMDEKPSIRRTKPGPYSKKYQLANNFRSDKSSNNSTNLCERCSNPRCKKDKKCQGLTATCFKCGLKGHFRGAAKCKFEKKKEKSKKSKKKFRKSRRLEDTSSDEAPSTQSSDSQTDSDSEQDDSGDSSEEEAESKRVTKEFRRPRITTIRLTKESNCRVIRKSEAKNRYDIDLIIKERRVPSFCDTGADICIISKKNAKKLDIPIESTEMRIRPYGSTPKKCYGKISCAVTHNDNVANVKFYVLDKDVETLLSGPVAEELGVITLNKTPPQQIKQVSEHDPQEKQLNRESLQTKEKLKKQYPEVFKGTGTLKNHKVKFHIDENIPPVSQPARPIPFHLSKQFDQEIEKMLEADIIEHHEGPAPWVSNSVPVPKPDGRLRVAVDMRCPNKAIKQTNIPIPRPEEISSQLAGYKTFSKLDFRQAFHQLELDEESRVLTVFHANGKLMRYKRLTMGTAPASGELAKALLPMFQKVKNAFVIQDDLIVAGKSKTEHDEALKQVMDIIKDSGMTLNDEKCIFAEKSIPWWGMVISSQGLSPCPEKVKAIKKMKPPKNRDEVKSLFCMLQSNKNFIPSLATKTNNIRSLLSERNDFNWNSKCDKEFKDIKEELSKDILLHHFDPELNTEIVVDAHKSGISAILMQTDKESKHMVAVASRATTDVESRYPQIDLESIAVDFGLRRFRFYIAGGPKVQVITDHKPLQSIFNNLRKGSIRTERIKLRHQDIDYEVIWKKGADNAADYLSRHAIPTKDLPVDQQEETKELEKTIWFLQFSPYLEAISTEDLIRESNQDATLRKLKKALKGGKTMEDQDLKAYKKIRDKLMITDSGLVMKDDRIILPESLVDKAISKAHQSSHPGITTMKRRLRTHFWYPKLNERIQNYVSRCKKCQMFNPVNRKHQLHPHQLKGVNAWEKISIDLFGPLPNKDYVLVAQDQTSCFPAAKVLKKTDAKHVTNSLDEFYTSYGNPMVHRTDNGPPFNSHEFTDFSNKRGIQHELAYPYHPQANYAETFMKPLGKCLKIANLEGKDHETAVNQLLASYRATPHSATNMAPGDIMFRHGYGGSFPKTTIPSDKDVERAIWHDQEQREIRDLDKNRNRRRPSIQVDDTVMARNNVRRKFEPVFGPEEYTVTTVSKGGVTMRNAEGKERRRHLDDVCALPSIAEEETTQEERRRHLDDVRVLPSGAEEETTPAEGQQSAQHEESHQAKRKSGRRRKPNTRIFNNDFVTST